MAILGSSYWNLIDVLKSSSDGIGDVVEALAQLTPEEKEEVTRQVTAWKARGGP